jgi:hypothetical protein
MQLRELGVDLEQEDDVAGFLGVTLEHDPETNLLEMKQTGLIKRVIEALGLDDGLVKGKHTPSKSRPLIKISTVNQQVEPSATVALLEYSYTYLVTHVLI